MTPSTTTHGPGTMIAAPSLAVRWDELLLHRGYLLRFARRRLNDPALAEDLVHDVFEAVASGRAAFAGRSPLRAWLTGILKHKITDLVRQRSGLDSLNEDLECPQPGPDELAQQRQALRQVLQGIAGLPQCLRDVMQLRVLQDQSCAEVCKALAITENNLCQRMFRARRCLADAGIARVV